MMRPIHLNLRQRRKQLADAGVKIRLREIAERLQAQGLSVGTAAVGHWFTGRNKPGVEELRALAEVLQTSMSALAGEDPDYAEEADLKLALRMLREMSPAERQAYIALMSARNGKS